MKWIDDAERKFGHLAIPNLIRIIAGFNALVFVLYKLNPHFLELLTLDPEAVKHGQVWRIFSYVFIPAVSLRPMTDWLIAVFYIGFIWWLGDGLENAMGSFRVNLYLLLGVAGTTAAAFLTGAYFTASLVKNTLLFAFARFYPEEVIYIMGLIPVKVKWLAWIYGILLVVSFLVSDWDYRLALGVAMANYFVFFGKDIYHDAVQRREVSARRERFESAQSPGDALHRCEVCGRTERQSPELEFRVSKDGHEYCLEHLPKPPPPVPPAAS